MKRIVIIVALLLLFCHRSDAAPQVFSHNNSDSVIGSVTTYPLEQGESLIEVARKFDLGYNEIAAANPGLDPFVPGEGNMASIPTSWILPDVGNREGIVINLSELRLFFFYQIGPAKFVRTFPIGIGSEGNDTPTGQFAVIEKIVRPSWHVPESIKKEKPFLPDVVPPGPENPLGSHAMRLSVPTILIHGTNKPWGVGRRVSHGCIRLYPEDIPVLFGSVPKSVKVTILRQPVKAGLKDERVYLEVHGEDGKSDSELFSDAASVLAKKRLLGRVDTKKLHYAIEEKIGMPVDISE
jgi:L,D-transpeptidase ErfK/SrfK